MNCKLELQWMKSVIELSKKGLKALAGQAGWAMNGQPPFENSTQKKSQNSSSSKQFTKHAIIHFPPGSRKREKR